MFLRSAIARIDLDQIEDPGLQTLSLVLETGQGIQSSRLCADRQPINGSGLLSTGGSSSVHQRWSGELTAPPERPRGLDRGPLANVLFWHDLSGGDTPIRSKW